MAETSARRGLRAAVLLLLAGGFASCHAAPAIEITAMPAYGAVPGWIRGRLSGADPAEHKITALIFLPGQGFFTKPSCHPAETRLAPDGSFATLLTTAASDQFATLIAVLALPASEPVPCCQGEVGIPAALEQKAVAWTLLDRPDPQQRQIQFAGETWLVKSSVNRVGPGSNYFSASSNNVWVDAAGRLHLKITHRDGKWECAEIITKRPVGYGEYTLRIDSPPQLDKNVVFGAFTWAEGERVTREVDLLELGVFGDAADTNNAQNVVQPYTIPGNQRRFFLPPGAPATHRMRWLPETVEFRAVGESGELLHEWKYGAIPPDASSKRLNFRLNLWLLAPPSNGREAEIVINDFRFRPVSKVGVSSQGAWLLDDNAARRQDGPAASKALAFGAPGDKPGRAGCSGPAAPPRTLRCDSCR